MDFTLKTYNTLITSLKKAGYSFKSFSEYLSDHGTRTIILRHDVDRLPENSLLFAKIQHDLGIKGTYYFRIVKKSWNEFIIKEIYSLGHEIGYHYEDVSLEAVRCKAPDAGRQAPQVPERRRRPDLTINRKSHPDGPLEKELADLAIGSFSDNLEKIRSLVPVKTICMHGAPLSRLDNRLLWKYYDYRDYGIIGEPYFDIDFSEVMYLTDTGRRWNGDLFNIRDRIDGERHFVYNEEEGAPERKSDVSDYNTSRSPAPSPRRPPAPSPRRPPAPPLHLHNTSDIIKAAQKNHLPDMLMLTFHPQRWTDKPGPWLRELVLQNVKNAAKYALIRIRTRV